MAKFRFQDLDIWKTAIEIGNDLFDIADVLEEKKLFRFAEQLRSAGMSMSNNIILNKRNLITVNTLDQLLERLDILCRKIASFQRTLVR